MTSRRRDRRGRGFRHDVIPPIHPAHRTRREHFEQCVLDSMAELHQRVGRRLDHVEVLSEDVPRADPAPWEEPIVLGRAFPGDRLAPPRIVIYRRPIELRADSLDQLAELVHSVLVQNVASLLGKRPQDIDPFLD